MFEKNYPYLATWVHSEGTMELGSDYNSSSLLRLLNEGGIVWEDEESGDMDTALQRAETYLKEEFPDEFYELEVE